MPHVNTQSKIGTYRTRDVRGVRVRPWVPSWDTTKLHTADGGNPDVNTRREPRDPAAYRRDRRQAVLRHHPDKGGDPEEMLRALDEVDRRHGVIGSAPGAQSVSAEQVAAVAVTTLAGVAAIGLSVAMSLLGRRR